MKFNKKNVGVLIVAISATFMFTGCGAKGEKFGSFKLPSENKSMLYVYRPSSFIGGGVYYDIHTNNNKDEIIGTLRNGGFIEKEITPNENTEIWAKTESKASVSIDMKPNETYCVKGGVGVGFLVGRPNLEIVDKTLCEKEIVDTQKSFD
ncbi:DUF2846 domain-containing protein [Arcobacter venerupis]|uniref:DUF2846 domain-containing protein n=1 Tax=Arcobacter venerupis TaxID=1054033 RepID=A0AAE7BA09_9BACT|nr:DUF2846 domain-containing protein [Arcobacter venerupis]QKF66660.1 DUF2846 domain-containing protein [Arcobacter venerupis]RWS49609.1 hypothetical protein CKA56_07755 [Arcobacter venerupis]